MTSAWDYSATAASNSSAAPDGAPENMAPSGVNDTMRKMMANVKETVTGITAGGTADALTVTLTNAPTSLKDGMEIRVRAAAANATTTPTLDVNSLGAKTIKKNGNQAVSAGDIPRAGYECIFRYNSSNTVWELLNPVQQAISLASTTDILTGTDAAKAATADAIAALWEQGSDVASAGTISLGEGGYFNITGTTTITDIDFATDKAGRRAWAKFSGALTLTHNASTLILPTGANITTAAGDTAEFVSEGSDAVRCVSYQRASGAALTPTTAGTLTAGTQCVKNPTAANTRTTQAHGLGTTPTMVIGYLECLTAELGYSIGDRVAYSNNEPASARGISIEYDATNVVIIINDTTVAGVNRKDTSAAANITAANWKFVATPYKLN